MENSRQISKKKTQNYPKDLYQSHSSMRRTPKNDDRIVNFINHSFTPYSFHSFHSFILQECILREILRIAASLHDADATMEIHPEA